MPGAAEHVQLVGREIGEDAVWTAFQQTAHRRGPKYLCLHHAIVQAVEAGALPPGTQLPAENTLARILGLSVGTVRRAMQSLSEEGVLSRRHGAGTFIADPALDMHDVWHFRFLNDDESGFLPLRARAVRVSATTAAGAWSEHMPDAERFVRVRRLVDVAGEFRILSDFYFDGERFAELLDLPRSEFHRVVLRNILIERFGVRTAEAPGHLRCAQLAPKDARAMGAEAGSPCMNLVVFGADARGRPIYYQRIVIPATTRRLSLDTRLTGGGG